MSDDLLADARAISRETSETSVKLRITRGEGRSRTEVGDPFLRHVIEIFARYARLDLDLRATGDLRHHLVEDVGITLGVAVHDLVRENVARFGWCVLPMDEVLVEAAIDVGGRPHFEGELPAPIYTHFLRSFAMSLEGTLHVRVLREGDRHHVVEAAIKAVGMALHQALAPRGSVFSTKGSVRLEKGPAADSGEA